MNGAAKLALDARLLLETLTSTDEQIALGVDVVDIPRLARQLETRSGTAFLASRFTGEERRYCEGRPERIAARWAAKEAVAKAIGTGFRGLRPRQIEIVRAQTGQPSVRAAGGESWPDAAHLWPWALTMSHEGDAAIAVALAVRPGRDRPTPEQPPTRTEGAPHG